MSKRRAYPLKMTRNELDVMERIKFLMSLDGITVLPDMKQPVEHRDGKRFEASTRMIASHVIEELASEKPPMITPWSENRKVAMYQVVEADKGGTPSFLYKKGRKMYFYRGHYE